MTWVCNCLTPSIRLIPFVIYMQKRWGGTDKLSIIIIFNKVGGKVRGNGDMESGGGEWRAGGQPTAGVAIFGTACGAGAGGGREY